MISLVRWLIYCTVLYDLSLEQLRAIYRTTTSYTVLYFAGPKKRREIEDLNCTMKRALLTTVKYSSLWFASNETDCEPAFHSKAKAKATAPPLLPLPLPLPLLPLTMISFTMLRESFYLMMI